MRELLLTKGMVTLIDDEDFDYLSQFNWVASKKSKNRYYAVRNTLQEECGKKAMISLHSVIMPAPAGFDVDHINGNSLDNRRSNLRVLTRRQNSLNRNLQKKSKYYGVTRSGDYWQAKIRFNNNKNYYIGNAVDEIDAATMYRVACVHLLGYDPYEVLTPSMQREREEAPQP